MDAEAFQRVVDGAIAAVEPELLAELAKPLILGAHEPPNVD
jgi:hypothetical protein